MQVKMTNEPRQRAILGGILIALAVGSHAEAQTRERPVHPARTIVSQIADTALTTRGSGAGAGSILGQMDGDEPRARLDSLAGGLAEAAIKTRSTRVVGAVIGALLVGGSSDARRPYEGAFAQLLRIYREASVPETRGAALLSMGDLPITPRTIAVWREIAMITSAEAGYRGAPEIAVDLLCVHGGNEGRAILADIHRTRAVKDNSAAAHLALIIESDFKRGCVRY
jgi:hypothetical protein